MPELENVANNYMECSMMLLGTKMRYAVAYTRMGKQIKLYKRKYSHDLQVQINDYKLEGSQCLELQTFDVFLVTMIN